MSGSEDRGLFTVADVKRDCGLPGPVIMQFVPHVWSDVHGGWMFTADQLSYARVVAADLREGRQPLAL